MVPGHPELTRITHQEKNQVWVTREEQWGQRAGQKHPWGRRCRIDRDGEVVYDPEKQSGQ